LLTQEEEGRASLLEMGGDSLGAVNLMRVIREKFAVSVPLAMILERPLDELVDYVEQNGRVAAGEGGGGADVPSSASSPVRSVTAESQSEAFAKYVVDWRQDSKLDGETLRLLQEQLNGGASKQAILPLLHVEP
jgi:hypothetical protein